VSLPKPLGVIQRSMAPLCSNSLDHDREGANMDGEEVKKVQATTSKWEMVAIVKKKIVFSKRPMPIVGTTVEGIPGKKS